MLLQHKGGMGGGVVVKQGVYASLAPGKQWQTLSMRLKKLFNLES